MELHDLLSDREFLDRTNHSNRVENRFEALEALARVFVDDPNVVLQKLVDIAVEYCGADSAGISLEEIGDDGDLRFRWVAVSGSFAKYLNGTTPRFYSPCGTCISAWRPQHYRVTKPYYDFLGVVADPINDGLLIPWASDESKGTIWAVSHGPADTFHPDDYKLLNTLAQFAGISVQLAERSQRTSSLRQLSTDLMRVQDEVGRRIARELHDSVGQYLSALTMNLAQLERRSPTTDKQILADSRQLVDDSLSEIRTISHLLHPPLLNERGLQSAAQWYVEGFSERSGVKVNLQVDETLGRLQEGIETTLFRVLQESLNNVHRHSASKQADVVIHVEGGKVSTSIRDYGCGFSPQQLREVKSGRSRGVGLTGLRERVAGLGGSFEVTSAEPGALIRVTLPLSR